MKKLILKNWRDIKARKAQFGALIVLVAMGILSYVSLISSYSNLTVSYEVAKRLLKMASFETKILSAPKTVVSRIEALPGVRAAQGRLIVDAGLWLTADKQAIARVVGVPPDHQPSVNTLLVSEGSYFKGGARDACLLDKHYATDAKVKVGDTIKLFINGDKKPVKVVGIVTSPEYLVATRAKSDLLAPGEFAVLFMAQKEVERLFQKPASYNDVAVLVKPRWSRLHVIHEVEHVLNPFQIIETVTQEEQPSNFTLLQEIQQNQSFGYMMPFLILTIATLSLSIALSRLVQSQRGEIGLAKALGYGSSQILLHYLFFSLFIALFGSLLGFVLGQLLAQGITVLYAGVLGLPFLTNPVHLDTVVGSILLSSSACVIAGLLPAYASARMPPATAMRADPNLTISKGSVPIVERLLARVVAVPFALRMPLRNIFRVRKRSFYTIVGMAFAVLLTLVTWTFFDIISYLFDYQFKVVEKWDVTAAYTSNFGRGRVNLVETWDGVGSVQPTLVVPVTLKTRGGATRETGVTGMAPNATFHHFKIVAGIDAERALEAGGLIMTPFIAKKMGVQTGDYLTVETPLVKNKRMPVALLAKSDELVGSPIFVSLDEARQLIRAPGEVYNLLYLRIDPRKTSDIKKKLYDLPGSAGVFVKQSLVTSLQDQMRFANIEFAVLFGFAFTMAFVVVYNTFTTNILERLREIATMRTIGEDRWHLVMIVTFENMLLALAGIPLGIWLGLQTSNAMYASLATEAFAFPVVLYPLSYVWIIGSILGVLLLSEIPPITRVFRLDLAEATKILE